MIMMISSSSSSSSSSSNSSIIIIIIIVIIIAIIENGRFPKFHRVCLGRDPGTLKSDIVSKKHPQLICSDSRLSN